jgi:hypothetical protein
MSINSRTNKFIGNSQTEKKARAVKGMTEEENNGFILILSDIGKDSERTEYLFRIIEIVIELPLSEFSEKY